MTYEQFNHLDQVIARRQRDAQLADFRGPALVTLTAAVCSGVADVLAALH